MRVRVEGWVPIGETEEETLNPDIINVGSHIIDTLCHCVYVSEKSCLRDGWDGAKKVEIIADVYVKELN